MGQQIPEAAGAMTLGTIVGVSASVHGEMKWGEGETFLFKEIIFFKEKGLYTCECEVGLYL